MKNSLSVKLGFFNTRQASDERSWKAVSDRVRERTVLIKDYRKGEREVSRRAHVLVLLDQG